MVLASLSRDSWWILFALGVSGGDFTQWTLYQSWPDLEWHMKACFTTLIVARVLSIGVISSMAMVKDTDRLRQLCYAYVFLTAFVYSLINSWLDGILRPLENPETLKTWMLDISAF